MSQQLLIPFPSIKHPQSHHGEEGEKPHIWRYTSDHTMGGVLILGGWNQAQHTATTKRGPSSTKSLKLVNIFSNFSMVCDTYNISQLSLTFQLPINLSNNQPPNTEIKSPQGEPISVTGRWTLVTFKSIDHIDLICSRWWFLTLFNFIFHVIYGMSSFPLMNSYFSRWSLHHQPVFLSCSTASEPWLNHARLTAVSWVHEPHFLPISPVSQR